MCPWYDLKTISTNTQFSQSSDPNCRYVFPRFRVFSSGLPFRGDSHNGSPSPCLACMHSVACTVSYVSPGGTPGVGLLTCIIVTGLESYTRCASRAHVVRLYVPCNYDYYYINNINDTKWEAMQAKLCTGRCQVQMDEKWKTSCITHSNDLNNNNNNNSYRFRVPHQVCLPGSHSKTVRAMRCETCIHAVVTA